MSHRLALSFHPAQAEQAQDLAHRLRAAGQILLPDAAQADRVLLFLSQQWMDEIWPDLAPAFAAPAQRERLLPLLAQPCALPAWLARARPLDLAQDPPALLAQILARLAPSPFRLLWQVDGDAQGGDRVLRGHSDFVTAVALLADGAQILSGSQDGSLILWDGQSGQALAALSGHTGAVLAVAVDPAGRALFSAGRDGLLIRWAQADGGLWQMERTWPVPPTVHTLALTPDGDRLILAAHSSELWVLDPQAQHPVVYSHLHQDWVRAVTILPAAPDGWLAVSAGDDHCLAVWEVTTGRLRQRWPQTGGFISALAPLPAAPRAANRLLAGRDDRTLCLWDLDAGRAQDFPQEHRASVRAVAATPDGRWALSAGNDGALILWDLASGQAVSHLQGHTVAVTQAVLAPDGAWAVSASTDSTLRRWQLADRPVGQPPLGGHGAQISALALSPTGDRLISAGQDGRLLLWDAATGAALGQATPRFPLLALAVAPGGDQLLAASDGGGVEVWSLPLGAAPVHTLAGRGAILSVAVSADGRTAAGGSVNWAIKLWDLAGSGPERSLRGHRGGVTALAFLPDGRLLSGDELGVLRLWDGTGGGELAQWTVSADPITAIAPAPGQPWAIIGGEGPTPRLIDLESGGILADFVGHTDWILGLGMLDGGRLLLTGADDATLRLWDAATGREVARRELPHPLAALAVDARGGRIYTGDTQGRLACFTVDFKSSHEGRKTGSSTKEVSVFGAESS